MNWFKSLMEFWDSHGTKILGSLATFVSTALLVPDLIATGHMKYWLFANALLGGGIVKRGFTNSKSTPPSEQGGFIRPMLLAILLVASVMTVLSLSGCAGSNPVQEAQTLEQKALAVYGSYIISKEQAAKLYADPVTPEKVREVLKKTNDITRDPMEALYRGVTAYKVAQEGFALGTTTDAQVQEAAETLLRLYLDAGPLLHSFQDEINKVRK